jgi:hypothetical protein
MIKLNAFFYQFKKNFKIFSPPCLHFIEIEQIASVFTWFIEFDEDIALSNHF